MHINLKPCQWPIRGVFRLSRDERRHVETVQLSLHHDGITGQAEARPYARYDETVASVILAVESIQKHISADLKAATLQNLLPAGAARNLVDCALWDWRSRKTEKPLWQLLNLQAPRARLTAITISLDTPAAMAKAAKEAAAFPILKLKCGTPEDVERLSAVRQAREDATLILDANEGWRPEDFKNLLPKLIAMRIALIEQPLKTTEEEALRDLNSPIPLYADESAHTAKDLPRLRGLYQGINIKLDKAGGLTEACAMLQAAKASGFSIMLGCMLASSLALRPATQLMSSADWVDLDAPLLLTEDWQPALHYSNATLFPAS